MLPRSKPKYRESQMAAEHYLEHGRYIVSGQPPSEDDALACEHKSMLHLNLHLRLMFTFFILLPRWC